ncbi:MAG TPA: cytochrome P460 family protein [Thermoanaerobaculia bacterium]|nr:cytochrome P460 family protein [Thermoanaerobaculia bacterium]
MDPKRFASILVVSAVCAAFPLDAGDELELPSSLANYRSWKKLDPKPRPVPWHLAMACAPSAGRLEEARKTHGPHADRWMTAYVNAIAAAAFEKDDASEFPIGSVLVKEKLIGPEGEKPEGAGVMIKRGAEFAASGGWEFQFYPAATKASSLDGCVACHRSGGKRDYVFGNVEREDDTDD